jgi:hypothetical protein
MAGGAVVQLADYQGPPPLDVEEGSGFGFYERLFLTWRDGKVFDYGDWHARDIADMLIKDYKAAQLEQVLSGPIEGVEGRVKPSKDDAGQAEWIQAFLEADEFSGGMDTPIELVRAQMTSAIAYKKAYFEKVWTRGTGDFEGRYVYSRLGFRPASTCRTMRSPQGKLLGFEQDPWYTGQISGDTINEGQMIEIPLKRAVVHVHGQRRDPINGLSDMDVPYWCYKTKQKVLFLWLQYGEQAALPRTVVKAQELGIAQQAAGQIARLKNSGVLPIAAPNGPQSLEVSTLDISGKGGEQFKLMIDWLDQAAVQANLAGFLQLTDYQKGGGSYALSADASDFFLQRLEAKKKEIERTIRAQVFAPLVAVNWGPGAPVPHYDLDPLNTEDVSPQVAMLQAMLAGRDPSLVPGEFVEEIAALVCERWGIDAGKMRTAFQEAQKRAEQQAKQMGVGAMGQQAAGVAGAVNAIGRQAKRAATGAA